MSDTRLPISGNLRLRWHPGNAFANDRYPQAAEINAGLDLGDAVSWNDYSFGVTGSNTSNDPALSAKSNTQSRGATQYGGSLSFYYPLDKSDMSNPYTLAYEALRTPRTAGYISITIDGELSETTTPTYTGGATSVALNGDYVHVFKVLSSGWTDADTGEEAFRFTISFLPQGRSAVYTLIGSGAAVVDITGGGSGAAGSVAVLKATVNGRPYTRGLRWASDDTAVATVSQNGVVTRVATGTADITATFVASGATDTVSITVA